MHVGQPYLHSFFHSELKGLGFRVWGFGFRVKGLGFRA